MNLLKRTALCLLCAALLLSAGSAAGDSEDPAISQSYLDEVFSSAFLDEVAQAAETQTAQWEARTLRQVEQQLATSRMQSARQDGLVDSGTGTLYTAAQDTVAVSLGTKLTVAEGTLTVQSGGWVDITAGTATAVGETLQIGHTYISTTDGAACRTDSAVGCVTYRGYCHRQCSGETDYASRADALAALGLFRGSTSGYELTRAATRTEALVMFLRILGQETAALATSASNPFSDVPAWAASYAAYAYQQGLVQGVGNGLYDASRTVTTQDYLTMLLRALGYQEGTDFTWATALTDAVRLGVLTAGEQTLLTQQPFTRAQMAYLSWQALMTPTCSGQLLLCQLRERGIVTQEAIAAAFCSLNGARIS